jgi:hypothetical protein
MSVEGDGFSADPAVQFSSGGRSVPFTISANATQAEFTPGSNQARFQTGSVASAITIKPNFATNSGLDLTPESPTLLRLTVAKSAPVILNVQISTRGTETLTLLINGFTTSRTLTRLDFTFTPVTGSRLAADRVSVNLETDAGAYFRTSGSTAFGGQFSVTMPFNFRSSATTTSTTTTSPVDQLQSVSVTATNEFGTSAAVSRDIR